jgi:hypothetical protein
MSSKKDERKEEIINAKELVRKIVNKYEGVIDYLAFK